VTDHDKARVAVLGRIRAALAAAPPAAVVVPRDYDREPLSGGGDVARFAETVAEYRAQVTRIDAAAIGATVASLVPTGGLVVIPGDLPAAWVEGVDTLADNPAHKRSSLVSLSPSGERTIRRMLKRERDSWARGELAVSPQELRRAVATLRSVREHIAARTP